MTVSYALAVAFLILIALGTIISVVYTLRMVYKLIFDPEDGEESISLMKIAKKSASKTKTPVFGESEWFVMLASVFWALSFKAASQNISKLVTQLEWREKDEESEMIEFQQHPLHTILFERFLL